MKEKFFIQYQPYEGARWTSSGVVGYATNPIAALKLLRREQERIQADNWRIRAIIEEGHTFLTERQLIGRCHEADPGPDKPDSTEKRNYTQAEAQKLRDALKRVLNAYTDVRFNDDRFRLEQAIDAAGNVMRGIESGEPEPRYIVTYIGTSDDNYTTGECYGIHDTITGFDVIVDGRSWYDTPDAAKAVADRLNGETADVLLELESGEPEPRYYVSPVATVDGFPLGYAVWDGNSRVPLEPYYDTAAEAQAEADRLNGQEGQS